MKFDITITFTNLVGFLLIVVGIYVLFFRTVEQSYVLFTVGGTLMTGGKIAGMFEKNSARNLEIEKVKNESLKIEKGIFVQTKQ